MVAHWIQQLILNLSFHEILTKYKVKYGLFIDFNFGFRQKQSDWFNKSVKIFTIIETQVCTNKKGFHPIASAQKIVISRPSNALYRQASNCIHTSEYLTE